MAPAVAFVATAATAVAGAAIAAAPAIGAAVGVYSIVESQKASKEAAKQAKAQVYAQEQAAKRQDILTEKQAGEYFELTQQQMELQTQMATIDTLADLLVSRQAPPGETRIFTTPAPVEYGAIERINMAIGDLLGMN